MTKFQSNLFKQGRTICSEIHKLINSIRNREDLPEGLKESVIISTCKKDSRTDCNN